MKRGDTLFSIARRLRLPGVTLNQMVIALYRANPESFVSGRINQLRVGAVLVVPAPEVALAVSVAQAAQEVRALIAAKPPAPAPAPVAEPKPAPPPVAAPAPKPAAKAVLGREEAERRHREGLALERRGDDKGALRAFLEAGEAGNGAAQKKLGEIYDRGTPAAPRDYATALKWYQRAREQGVAVPKPEVRAPALR